MHIDSVPVHSTDPSTRLHVTASENSEEVRRSLRDGFEFSQPEHAPCLSMTQQPVLIAARRLLAVCRRCFFCGWVPLSALIFHRTPVLEKLATVLHARPTRTMNTADPLSENSQQQQSQQLHRRNSFQFRSFLKIMQEAKTGISNSNSNSNSNLMPLKKQPSIGRGRGGILRKSASAPNVWLDDSNRTSSTFVSNADADNTDELFPTASDSEAECTLPDVDDNDNKKWGGCLKIRTQERSESLEYAANRKRRSAPAAARRAVSFSTATLHSHQIVLGDNPAVTSGPPLALGWKAFESATVDLDEYEALKPSSSTRKKNEMLVPRSVREDMLKFAGFSRGEMNEVSQQMAKIRQQRADSSQDLKKSPVQRAVRKFLSLRKSSCSKSEFRVADAVDAA